MPELRSWSDTATPHCVQQTAGRHDKVGGGGASGEVTSYQRIGTDVRLVHWLPGTGKPVKEH